MHELHNAQDTMRHGSRGRVRFPVVLRVLVAFGILHLALLAGGCAKAQAKAAPDGPPLNVPTPPPRVLVPVEEEPPLAEAPPDPEEAAPPPRTAATPPRRPAATRPATPQVQNPPEEPKAEAPSPPPTEAPAARPLTQADAAADRRIRGVMGKAKSDLERVDYRKLSADGQAQYEASKRFNEQAEQALKDRNYTFASTLADKAAALATELLGGR